MLATFGRPAVSYRWGAFTIMVWRQNVLPVLAAPAVPYAPAGT